MSQPTPGSTLPPPPPHHPPAAEPVVDPRFPWKAKGTRKRLSMWDRSKFLMLFAAIFGLLTWNEYLKIEPLGGWGDAAQQIAASSRWLLVLICIEAVRQVHYLISEVSRGWHQFWTVTVFGKATAAYERRFNPWNRYRIARVTKWILFVILLALVLGKVTGSPPVVALFQAPALMVKALPFIFQILLFMFIMVMQFVAMFWFLSRGGVETYFPDDIETRFTDVWGQDHVLERVKENVILLEDPESIEEKGGHVPSGILLWGPPGTGKTLMAEAVAGETGKPYVFVDPGAFTAMFIGIGILKVKSLFRKLRKLSLRYGGVIVFFDEADTLGSRGARTSGMPQPGGAMSPRTAPQWDVLGCSGFAHLGEQTRWTLTEHTMPAPQSPQGWRNRFVVGAGMGGGSAGFDGTLQALLTELSGLKKPRGFINRVVRRTLGMKPKPPPKYRILVMMASNLPEALDPALLRPGRIDRMYKVGYPSKAGRMRTYQGYFDKVTHDLTPDQIEKIATITPYATGASIKDLVNEALIYAIGDGREVVTWKDVIKAKHLKSLGPSEGVEYVEEERHATAVHEACHAVMAWKTRRHLEIDIATIEKGSTYLGMVSSIPPEERFTQWRSEYESDILVALASLAGERMFYGGDNSSGVSGDLHTATLLASLMESYWGMGAGVSALPALRDLGIGIGTPEDKPKKGGGGGIGFGSDLEAKKPDSTGGALPQRIEQNLVRLLGEAERLLEENRLRVLALAHALETHKTLTGDDVTAILEGRPGPLVDGRPYADPAFLAELETYHAAAVDAHQRHASITATLPEAPVLPGGFVQGRLIAASTPEPQWVTVSTPGQGGSHPGPGAGGATAQAPMAATAPPVSQPGGYAPPSEPAGHAGNGVPAGNGTSNGNGTVTPPPPGLFGSPSAGAAPQPATAQDAPPTSVAGGYPWSAPAQPAPQQVAPAAPARAGVGKPLLAGLAATVGGVAVWALFDQVTKVESTWVGALIAVLLGLLIGQSVAVTATAHKALPALAAVLAVAGGAVGSGITGFHGLDPVGWALGALGAYVLAVVGLRRAKARVAHQPAPWTPPAP